MMASVYPIGVIIQKPEVWPRARRLDAIASALVGHESALPVGAAASNFRIVVAASKVQVLDQLLCTVGRSWKTTLKRDDISNSH